MVPTKFIQNSHFLHLEAQNTHVEAFEIEFDHRFEIVGEWHDAELLYNRRLLSAATSSIINAGDISSYANPALLPIYRLKKAFSMAVNQFGFTGPIPPGIRAQTQLIYDGLENEQERLIKDLKIRLAAYEETQNHKATYLKMLITADEIKSGQIAGL